MDSGLTRIRFSFDAFTQDTYSKVRVGAFSKVIRNVETFLELKKGNYKLPIVGVSFVSKQNEHEVVVLQNFGS